MMEGEVEAPPRSFSDVIWRIVEDIRVLRAQGREDDAIRFVRELRTYAVTFSKRRDILFNIEKIENYIIEKILSADIKNKEELIHKIDATFAFSIVRPLSLLLLPMIRIPASLPSTDELLTLMAEETNDLLQKYNAPFTVSEDELKKVISNKRAGSRT